MAALTKNKVRAHKLHERALNVAPANAGDVFYVGAYIVREAATGLATPGGDIASVVPLGVIVEDLFPSDPDAAETAHLDNTNGADGVITADDDMERVVRYDQVGEYDFAVINGTPKVGDPAYLSDDNTVSVTSLTNSIIAGHFTRPGKDGWFIDIARRGIS